jgi:putative nucleotidyltransferase with HDIG domain
MVAKGRLLFVDDEPRELESLRAQSALLGEGWELAFADSAAQGLEAFAHARFDVVVADLRMPGMDGAAFLQEIMARYPSTLRLLMADLSDRTSAMQNLVRSHQFLGKPCDLAFLRSLAEFSLEHGKRVGNDHVRELVTRIGQLPALPDLYRQINDLLESERCSADRLGQIIGQDIAMTAMILKLANSAFFGLRHTISSATEAVSYLGIDLLKALILAHGLFGQVGSFRIPGFTLHHLWEHCLSVAASARHMAETERNGLQPSECFTAGILHDIGILILASRLPEDYARVLDINRRAGGDLEAAEFHVFGATHSEVGAYLLSLWGIPHPVVQAAAHHHCIARQPSQRITPALMVHVANALYGAEPVHEIFSRTYLDEPYLASLNLLDHLPRWREASGLQGIG